METKQSPGCWIYPATWNFRIRRFVVILLLCCVLVWGEAPEVQPAKAQVVNSIAQSYQIFLPMVSSPQQFDLDTPIWTHTSTPASHEVALFRNTFSCGRSGDASLNIFADTRYEVWLDGHWVGRGPARFSQSLREYDVYTLPALTAGTHTLAVLVQWAPNNRRSESVRPLLQGHIEAQTDTGNVICTRTGSNWKAFLSDAWRTDASLVHTWGLIGPTELLDLNHLANNWFSPDYSAEQWPSAVVVSPDLVQNNLPEVRPFDALSYFLDDSYTATRFFSAKTTTIAPIQYNPRSIPLLIQQPISVTVIQQGRLSPGYRLGILNAQTTFPYQVYVSNSTPITFALEILSPPNGIDPATITVDGDGFVWQPVGAARPGVSVARQFLQPGQHKVVFSSLLGATEQVFAFSTTGVNFAPLPFAQGTHAGQRMLLANLVPEVSTSQSALPDPSIHFAELPAYVVLDLGRTVHGRMQVDVIGPAGTIVDVGWDERLWQNTSRPLPYPGALHPQWNQVDSWVLDGSQRILTTIDARAGRYVLIAVWGTGSVDLNQIRVWEERYPVTQKGTFTSSDPLLNQIWQVGITTAYPNMTDAYTDTPWRERGQWWGDTHIIERVNRVAFGDLSLVRRGLRYMAEVYEPGFAPGAAPNNNHANIMDYMMLWVHDLLDYTQLSGENDVLQEVYPVLVQFMQQLEGYQNQNSNLLNLPMASWTETVYIETLGYHSRYGQSAAVNALYYSTLLKAAALAAKVGDAASQVKWEQQANDVRVSMNALLYLPSQNRYLTNIYQGTPYTPTVQAQAWSLAYGISDHPQQVADSLLALISPDPSSPNIEIYGMFWVLEGLGRAGRISDALEIIKKYYSHMLDQGAVTWWEGFNANLSYTGSLSHGWGGSPTWFLTTYVLGLHQTGPSTLEIRPAYQLLSTASGTIPLQSGNVTYSWNYAGCNVDMDIVMPPDAQGILYLPPENLTAIVQNGRIFADFQALQSASLQKGEIALPLLAGESHLNLQRQNCFVP
jgi:alpha-L-rhamnosidase